MNISNQIKNFTLSFFKTIGANIDEKNGLYTVDIPKDYFNYFQKSEIVFAFDENIAQIHNCELIIPGSKILFNIITNCKNKGPISVKSNGGENIALSYYFYVNFHGAKQYSQLFSVIIDLETISVLQRPKNLSKVEIPENFKLPSQKITPSFELALNELEKITEKRKSNFIHEAEIGFRRDFELFVKRYDDEIRELDSSISEKDSTSNDFEKTKKFRFDTLEKIKKIEHEKNNLISILQDKHQVNLDYNLVSSEIIFH